MANADESDAAPQAAPKLNFIRDVAADADFFGSHERVAEAIANVISTNDDLKVIGLLGRWGSGKSTVVRHVQKHLDKLDGSDGIKTHVFCYDAWLHQSDPPRRSFLETLVAFLASDGQKLTTQERWQLQLDILNRQVEDTETTSTPSLAWGGRWLLLSLALIPLGMHFIGHDWYMKSLDAKASWLAQHAFLAGWILLAIPPISAVLIALFGKQEGGSLLSLFVNRQVHKQVNRVTRNPDPTTIEFQKIFRAIIAGLPEGKRLMFVIDNLDRLHEAEAVSMWNTIRSFFLGSEHADRASRGARLPTVLLPIDQDAVERIYSKDHGPELGKRLARAFLDKTFDLSFHVTPPVLSDWNRYLASQLKLVFGDALDEAWAYQVGRLYEARSRNGQEITPRAINVTINDIATLWLQWRNEIPFVTIAYFVVFRDRIEGDIFSAVSSPIVSITDLDPEWQRGLAALHYGASTDKAIQVLIEPRLRSAFEDWDDDEFKVLAELPGFAETFQRLLDGAQQVRPPFVAQASYLLSELKPVPAAWVSAAWASLRTIYAQGQPYEKIDEADVDAIKLMLDNCPLDRLPVFIRQASTRLSQTMEPAFAADGDARANYVEMVSALVAAAKKHDLGKVSVRHLGGADTYLETLQHAADEPDTARAILHTGDDQLLVDALTAQMATTQEAGTVDAKFRALLHKNFKVKWDGLIEASRKYLAEQSGTTAGTYTAATILGHFWKDSELSRKAVHELGESGAINNRISQSYQPNRYPRMSRLTALAILDEQSLDNPGGNSWDAVLKAVPSLADLVRSAMDKFDNSGTLHHLITVARQTPDAAPLCRAIVTKKVQLGDLGPLYVDRVVDEFPDYLKCVESAQHLKFVGLLTEYGALWDELDKREFDDNTRRILKALATTSAASGNPQKSARKSLKSRLQGVSQSDWKAAVQSGAEPLETAKALANATKQSLNVGVILLEALKGMLPTLVSDELPDWTQRWFEAAKLLSAASRKAIHRYLRDRIFSASLGPGLPSLLSSGGDLFVADADFASVGDSTLRHVVAPMLTSNEGLTWLSENTAFVDVWIKSAPEDAREFLKEQVQHRANEVDEAKRKRLKSLAADWAL